ncbi:hypothetical protein C6P64_07395 [Malikia granosa]|uniref:Uncharacterized protein n=1 Tax=Malikia granosa TaxID=263067 RepID=A0A2S9K697_9BURK|nr:hypothetical protein C6P64_07395 [Malikia granosa]
MPGDPERRRWLAATDAVGVVAAAVTAVPFVPGWPIRPPTAATSRNMPRTRIARSGLRSWWP